MAPQPRHLRLRPSLESYTERHATDSTSEPAMRNVPLYLRPNVVVEPLFDSWYAWPHLIPPATASRNITERHLKILDSYIDNPEIHASAVRNRRLRGGPFVDYDGRRVEEIRECREQTRHARANLLKLSSAIGELDAMLQNEAKGF